MAGYVRCDMAVPSKARMEAWICGWENAIFVDAKRDSALESGSGR